MRIQFDADRCQGHALCTMHAPEVFASSEEDGHAVVLIESVPAELQEQASRAVAACPEQAITIS